MYTTNVVIRKRITILLILVSMLLFALVARLAWIQFVMGNDLIIKAIENRTRDVPIEAKRGTIYDRNGKELAVSISADSVYVTPKLVKKPRETAQKVAEVLGLNEEKVYKIITKKSRHEWIQHKADATKVKKLKELQLAGIGTVDQTRRYYPNENLASHLLGFVQLVDNIGGNGIELTYDSILKGIPGKMVKEYDAGGREIPGAIHRRIEPVDGNSLYLTIDETIQHFVERELDKVVETYKPKHTSIIVMDPKTGQILAMGNRPDFNPNKYAEFPQETWRNFAVSDAYEPGSTFKVVTASAGLEEGVVRPKDQFYDPGFIEVLGNRVKCWKAGGHGAQTFAEVVQNSCNPGFINVGLRLGVEKFMEYVEAYGFGKKTGISLPGEATGILVPTKRATNLDLATMSIGQSNAVTPIQLITAMSAIANGGQLMKPQLVKEITNAKGEEIEQPKPEKVRQVISKETAEEMHNILESVVAQGSGSKGFIEGYRAAGKTGTAQKAGPKGGYVSGKYVASFCGFAPANNPKIAVLVIIDEPQGAVYYGGQIAAPIFGAVAGDILKYMGVPPQINGLEKKQLLGEPEKLKETTVPDVVNLPLTEARQLLQEANLKGVTEGDGKVVLGQFPLAGATVTEGTEINLYMVNKGGGTQDLVTVPNVVGKSLREAAAILGAVGLTMDIEGSGEAMEQEPVAGTKVKAGQVVRVKFSPPTTTMGP